MAVLIFREMGWQPERPIELYLRPPWLVVESEARRMGSAGQKLFELVKTEPIISASVQMDLGLFYRLTEFVQTGAFIAGSPGSYRNAEHDF